MAKLISPGHVSVGGKLYQRDEKTGTVDVPDEHVEHLVATHGLQRHSAPAPAPKKDLKAD